MFSIFILLVLHKPTTTTLKRHQPFNLNNTLVSNIHFYIKTFQAIKQYQDEMAQAKHFLSDETVWKIKNVHPHYQNYVLIIGESVRADYLSPYGFPIDTSPYLKHVNGLILDNFIAPSPNTQLSLTRMLHLTHENQAIFSNNIISLANAAGFQTYWFSTQPTGQDADTAASRVGIQAKYTKFYEPNAPRAEIGKFSDMIVLDDFKTTLANYQKSKQPSLYVFHINGSHPDFCKRLIQPVSETFKSKEMSCYLETLKQTDKLIEEITKALQATGSYSLIYLSDHGLAHINKNSANVTLTNSPKQKQAYHVPFIRISSDDTHQSRQQAARSGFYFIHGFAEWLGIDEPKLKLPYRFFSEEPTNEIKVFDWEKIIPYNRLEDDVSLKP